MNKLSKFLEIGISNRNRIGLSPSSFVNDVLYTNPTRWWRLGEANTTIVFESIQGTPGEYRNANVTGSVPTATGATLDENKSSFMSGSYNVKLPLSGKTIDVANAGSISFLVNFNTFKDCRMFNTFENTSGNGNIFIDINDDPDLTIQSGGTSGFFRNRLDLIDTYFDTNRWYFWTFAWEDTDATKTKFYSNGIDQTSLLNVVNNNLSGTTPADTLYIGSNDVANLQNTFSGIQDVIFHDRILTLTEHRRIFAAIKQDVQRSKILAQEPIAYYPLWDNDGTTAEDLSGNELHGTYTNGPTLNEDGPQGAGSPSVQFDGINDYVDCEITDINSALLYEKDFSVGCWFSVDSVGTAQGILGSLVPTPSDRSGFFLQLGSNGEIEARNVRIAFSNTRGNATANDIIKTNKWYHVFVTHASGSDYKIYINGNEQPTTSVNNGTMALDLTGSNFKIADRGDLDEFGGKIAHVAIFDKELSSVEVSELIEDVLPPISERKLENTILDIGPVAYWPLSEASNIMSFDLTGSHTGTYTNGPTLYTPSPISNLDGAVSFDGINDYVNYGNDINETLSGSWSQGFGSFSFWMNTVTPPTLRYIFDNKVAGSNSKGINCYIDPADRMVLRFARDGTQQTTFWDVGSYLDDEWHHFSVAWSSGSNTLNVWADGEEIVSSSLDKEVANFGIPSNDFYLCANNLITVQSFSGSMAHFAIFDKVLTDSQAKTIYSGSL